MPASSQPSIVPLSFPIAICLHSERLLNYSNSEDCLPYCIAELNLLFPPPVASQIRKIFKPPPVVVPENSLYRGQYDAKTEKHQDARDTYHVEFVRCLITLLWYCCDNFLCFDHKTVPTLEHQIVSPQASSRWKSAQETLVQLAQDLYPLMCGGFHVRSRAISVIQVVCRPGIVSFSCLSWL